MQRTCHSVGPLAKCCTLESVALLIALPITQRCINASCDTSLDTRTGAEYSCPFFPELDLRLGFKSRKWDIRSQFRDRGSPRIAKLSSADLN